jgi:adenylate cyclase
MTATRRLAAILAADVVGYSRQMGEDEAGTMARLRAVRAEVVEPLLAEYRGRLFKAMGDGFLAEFSSAVQAVGCARAIQERMAGRNASAPEGERLQLRIGLHTGDVLVEGEDLFGDGVNIAARLEALAEPGGICISARVREDAAGKLSLDVEDLGTPDLKNIAQPVRVFRVRLGAAERSPLALPDKPSLVVLPFQNMSGDPEEEYFADGVVEDITTAISRTGWLLVTSRNTAFTYKGRPVDVREVGRHLGVRYALEGSIRKAGGRVRITCQLIETAGGNHVWADRFDSDLTDVFELQDRITESVVGAIEPGLQRAEIARASAKPTESLDAYDLYLRALPYSRVLTEPSIAAAIALLRRALAIDPAYPRAKAALAAMHATRDAYRFREPGDRDTALALAREVIAGTGDDPDALRLAGFVLSFAGADYPAAFAALRRALLLHPNSAQVLYILGLVHCHADEPDQAIDYYERALRLSPLDPESGYMVFGLGLAHLLAGRTTLALPLLERAIQDMPSHSRALHLVVLALVRLGRLDEARAVSARLRALGPVNQMFGALRVSNRAFLAELQQALATAGIVE